MTVTERNADVLSFSLSLLAEPACWHTYFLWFTATRKTTPGLSVYKGPHTCLNSIKQNFANSNSWCWNSSVAHLAALLLSTFQSVWTVSVLFCLAQLSCIWSLLWSGGFSLACAGFSSSVSGLCAWWSPGLTNGLLPLGYFCCTPPCSTLFQCRRCPCSRARATPAPVR